MAERLPLRGTVQSVVQARTNGALIAAAAELWIRDSDLVVDVTYGGGRFWTEFQPKRFVAHDLHKGDGVDCRALPEADGSVDVVVLDLPYIAQGGRDTSTKPDFLDRFGLDGAPKNHPELERLFTASMTEAERVLAPSGRLFVKCMDYINGGKLRLTRQHVATVATAEGLGLEQADEFVHYSGTGPQSRTSQLHSRRAHSFLCIFQKRPFWRHVADADDLWCDLCWVRFSTQESLTQHVAGECVTEYVVEVG